MGVERVISFLFQILWTKAVRLKLYPLLALDSYMKGYLMIITKVRKHSKQDKVISSQPSASTEATTSGIHVSLDDIRVCAFHLYEKRGSTPGYDVQDWIKAERLITER